jgi:GNAT superfamily N-acetyltransferase
MVRIETAATVQHQILDESLEWVAELPYQHFRLNRSELVRFIQERMAVWIRQGASVFEARGIRGGLAVAVARRLPWDTQVLGVPAARIEWLAARRDPVEMAGLDVVLSRTLEWTRREGIRFLDVKINSQDIHLVPFVERHGFHLMDLLTIHAMDLKRYVPRAVPAPCVLRSLIPSDVPILAELTAQAFSDQFANLNRFVVDPHFSRDSVETFHREWFRNCANGSQARHVCVATLADAPIGYLAIQHLADLERLSGRRLATVPLNAVSHEARGRGIYKALCTEAFDWLRRNGYDAVEVRTQVSNLAVERTWQAFGGYLAASYFTFHRWES